MREVWVDIVGYEGLYQISNMGRVKALSKIIHYVDGRNRRYSEIIMKNRIDSKGYPFVSLYMDRESIQCRVH